LEQVVSHSVDHMVHQLSAVVDGLDPDVAGEGGLDLVQLVLHRPGDLVAVLAHEHEAQAEDHLPLAVGRDAPPPDPMPDHHAAAASPTRIGLLPARKTGTGPLVLEVPSPFFWLLPVVMRMFLICSTSVVRPRPWTRSIWLPRRM